MAPLRQSQTPCLRAAAPAPLAGGPVSPSSPSPAANQQPYQDSPLYAPFQLCLETHERQFIAVFRVSLHSGACILSRMEPPSSNPRPHLLPQRMLAQTMLSRNSLSCEFLLLLVFRLAPSSACQDQACAEELGLGATTQATTQV